MIAETLEYQKLELENYLKEKHELWTVTLENDSVFCCMLDNVCKFKLQFQEDTNEWMVSGENMSMLFLADLSTFLENGHFDL